MNKPNAPSTEGLFEPLTEEEEIISALCNDDPALAAKLLRQIDGAGKYLLNSLADLLDGDARANPQLRQLYARRLKSVSWGIAGRPRLGANSRPKSKPNRKSTLISSAWQLMIARKVRRLLTSGHTLADAMTKVVNTDEWSAPREVVHQLG